MLNKNIECIEETICVFTTRWGAHFGGINVFNREMCIGIKNASSKIKLICIVEDFDQEEENDSLKYDIHLIKIKKGTYPMDIVEYLHEKKIYPSAWIGHDMYTGSIAIDCSKLTISISAVISHFDYEYYGSYKGNIGKVVEEKMLKQQKVLSDADLTFSVGPKLKNTVTRLTNKQPIVLNPGCFPIVKTNPNISDGFFAMSSGRLELNDDNIKRVSLVMDSYSKISKEIYMDKMLTIFGIEESRLESIAKNNSENILNIKALEFSKDREHIFQTLSKQTMFIMPSLHEGFGLTGLEAISMEVPLIISSNSGLYEMLNEKGLSKYVCVIHMTGDNDRDSSEIYMSMKKVFIERKTYKENAIKLKKELDKNTSWKNLGHDIINNLYEKPLKKIFPIQNKFQFNDLITLSYLIDLENSVENLFIKYKSIIDPNNGKVEKKYGYILYQIIAIYQSYKNVQIELDEQELRSKEELKEEEKDFYNLLDELSDLNIEILDTEEAEKFNLKMDVLKELQDNSSNYNIEDLDFLSEVLLELESFDKYLSDQIEYIENAEANIESFNNLETGPLSEELSNINSDDKNIYNDLLYDTNALMNKIKGFINLNLKDLKTIKEELDEIESERKDNITNSLFNFDNIIKYLENRCDEPDLSDNEEIYIEYCLIFCKSFKIFSENDDKNNYEPLISEELKTL